MEKRNIEMPSSVKFILDRLDAHGYRADIVGGPVRDHILGKCPSDYDITTSALPETVERIFSDLRVIETGIKHGTVTLLIDGEGYEVTTYRIDGEYKDSRRPESVEFTTDVTLDLSRRDFTMNAIAYNAKDGITDPFGGEEDIRASLIRAVGEPERRFREDALRILRGIRFSSTLGFTIEEETHKAILRTRALLSNVSAERIYVEWKKLLSGDHALCVLDSYREVTRVFLPEIADTPLPDSEKFASADYMTRLLSLFCLSGRTGEEFYNAMRRLRTDSATAEDGRAVLEALPECDLSSGGVGRLLSRLGEGRAILLASLATLLGKTDDSALSRVEDYLRQGRAYRLSDLKIGGRELISLGFVGKDVGLVLAGLLDNVIDGVVENTETALLEAARKYKIEP